MPSPFPGMDPYLESPAYWADFHATFITYWRDAVTDHLPDNYEARIDRRVVLEEPPEAPLLILDKPKQGYIKVIQRPGRMLIAVLELLSPSNKAGADRGADLAKRDALLHQEVHLVELDLLLRGRRLPMDAPLPPGHYYAFVS